MIVGSFIVNYSNVSPRLYEVVPPSCCYVQESMQHRSSVDVVQCTDHLHHHTLHGRLSAALRGAEASAQSPVVGGHSQIQLSILAHMLAT